MCVCARAFVPGDAGGPGADHQSSGHEAVLFGPAEEQTARPQLLGDPAPAAVGADEPGRLPVSAHHVSARPPLNARCQRGGPPSPAACQLDLTLLCAAAKLSPPNVSRGRSLRCSELRERIQPEILELIKQQRLNRLCEGSCFRKLGNRRRQG